MTTFVLLNLFPLQAIFLSCKIYLLSKESLVCHHLVYNVAGLQIFHMLKKPVWPQLNLGGIVSSALNNLAKIGGIILGHPI